MQAMSQEFRVGEQDLRGSRVDCLLNTVLLAVHLHLLYLSAAALGDPRIYTSLANILGLGAVLCWALIAVLLVSWTLLLLLVEVRHARVEEGEISIQRLAGGEQRLPVPIRALVVPVRYPTLRPPYVRAGRLLVSTLGLVLVSDRISNYEPLLERLLGPESER
jgi:hypothetical protein